MDEALQKGSALKETWKEIADRTESQWDQQFWRLMASRAPLPNVDAHEQSHLILSDFYRDVRLLLDSLERSGLNLSQWQPEVDRIKAQISKAEALSDMFSADWHT